MSVSGTLYLVSTPIGNLSDFTFRAVDVLRSCDTILAEDTRRTRILLDHHDITAGSVKSFHQHNEAARTQEIIAELTTGRTVALVSDSGTPLISDPGMRLVRAALDAGAGVTPIPGPSAVLAALVASGLESEPFTFLGFLPRGGRRRRELLERLKTLDHTAVLFESPHRLADTLSELAAALGEERGAVVARELTKVHEQFVRGTLAEVTAYYGERAPKGEVVLCLGAAPQATPGTNMESARRQARSLAREGATSKVIVRALRDRYGLDRNVAYALALEAAEEATE